MRLPKLTSVVLMAALWGCAATPLRNSELDDAHVAVQTLEAQPNASEIASKPLQDARDALAEADHAAMARRSPEYVNHWAYIARRDADLGEALLAEARARTLMEQGEARRNRVLLEAREREIRAAKEQTLAARTSAAAAEADAAAARTAEERARMAAAEQARDAQASAADAAAARDAEERTRMAAAEQAREAQANAAAAEANAMASRQAEENARRLLLELQVAQTERGLVMTLGNVLFDTGTASLKPGANLALDRLARYMQITPSTSIIVEGHTDSRGSDEYNEELSRRRSQSVADALESRGIGADRVRVVGRGKRFPVASNDTPEGRQHNRRVEIVFSDARGKFAQGASRE